MKSVVDMDPVAPYTALNHVLMLLSQFNYATRSM